jgi:hypothetical protein
VEAGGVDLEGVAEPPQVDDSAFSDVRQKRMIRCLILRRTYVRLSFLKRSRCLGIYVAMLTLLCFNKELKCVLAFRPYIETTAATVERSLIGRDSLFALRIIETKEWVHQCRIQNCSSFQWD